MRNDPSRVSSLRECDECGKKFIPGGEHLYRLMKNNKSFWYCSYSCWKKNGGDQKRGMRNYIEVR